MADFQKRHYEAVANLLAEAEYLDPDVLWRLVEDFKDLFGYDNLQFKSYVFEEHVQSRRAQLL